MQAFTQFTVTFVMILTEIRIEVVHYRESCSNVLHLDFMPLEYFSATMATFVVFLNPQ